LLDLDQGPSDARVAHEHEADAVLKLFPDDVQEADEVLEVRGGDLVRFVDHDEPDVPVLKHLTDRHAEVPGGLP
jgi:hypothetical protein